MILGYKKYKEFFEEFFGKSKKMAEPAVQGLCHL